MKKTTLEVPNELKLKILDKAIGYLKTEYSRSSCDALEDAIKDFLDIESFFPEYKLENAIPFGASKKGCGSWFINKDGSINRQNRIKYLEWMKSCYEDKVN